MVVGGSNEKINQSTESNSCIPDTVEVFFSESDGVSRSGANSRVHHVLEAYITKISNQYWFQFGRSWNAIVPKL